MLTRRIETQRWRRRLSHGAYWWLPGVSEDDVDDDVDDDDDDDDFDGDDDDMAEALDLALAPEQDENQLELSSFGSVFHSMHRSVYVRREQDEDVLQDSCIYLSKQEASYAPGEKSRLRLRAIVFECKLALRREMMFYITNGVPIPSWTRLVPQTDLPFLYGSPWMDGGISAVPLSGCVIWIIVVFCPVRSHRPSRCH